MRGKWLWVALAMAAQTYASDSDRPTLPDTIDERNATCVKTEDADPKRAVALAESVLEEGPTLTTMQRAEALGCRGWSQAVLGRHDGARRDGYALAELVSRFSADADRVRLTRRAGSILHRSDDRVGALDLYADAVTDAETQGLEAERIPLLVNLGVLHWEFEEHQSAQISYERALALMERLGDHRYEASVRYNLGLNLIGQERFADAVPHLRRALALVRESGMGGAMQELSATILLASALQGAGDTTEVQALVDRANAIDVAVRDPYIELQLTLVELTQLANAGDQVGALAMLDAVEVGELQEIQRWQILSRRAELLERLGRYQQATAVLRKIDTLREDHLRHQNRERLAALDARMRDREQRLELMRLQANADELERRAQARERLSWASAVVAVLVLLFGFAVLLWQRRMNKRLYLASHTDPLTGLANRREMRRRLGKLSLDPHQQNAVMLIDIDLFKCINDEHGHDVGDQVLVVYGQRLRETAKAGVGVARWGGEEFLVTIPNCNAEQVAASAQSLLVRLAQPISTAAGTLQVGASLGYANLPLPGQPNPESWHYSLQLADNALYLAKRSGRDAWAGYWIDAQIPEWPPERLGGECELARSLKLITLRSSGSLRDAMALAMDGKPHA